RPPGNAVSRAVTQSNSESITCVVRGEPDELRATPELRAGCPTSHHWRFVGFPSLRFGCRRGTRLHAHPVYLQCPLTERLHDSRVRQVDYTARFHPQDRLCLPVDHPPALTT